MACWLVSYFLFYFAVLFNLLCCCHFLLTFLSVLFPSLFHTILVSTALLPVTLLIPWFEFSLKFCIFIVLCSQFFPLPAPSVFVAFLLPAFVLWLYISFLICGLEPYLIKISFCFVYLPASLCLTFGLLFVNRNSILDCGGNKLKVFKIQNIFY